MKLYLLILALGSGPAWAWPPIFGPEFTFTNEEIIEAVKKAGGSKVRTAANERFLWLWEKRCRRSVPKGATAP